MIEGIEALIALERTGTISEAATQLRLTQSAISKRIQSLQDEVGFRLIEPDGRRVRLTSRGMLFLEKAKPLVADLKSLVNINNETQFDHFSLALADSIAASWGPKLIKKVLKKIKNLDISLHVHRSVLVQEHVKLGRYHLGLCTSPIEESDLNSIVIAEEELIVIACEFKDRIDSRSKMITIEKGSSTWKAVGTLFAQHPRLSKYEYLHVESFSAAIQMAKEGFGNALVPLGLASAMHVPSHAIHKLSPTIKREIRLICRKNVSLLPQFKDFQAHLRAAAREII
jgi:DNA-binding transcriptional LysR family regulator